MAEPMTMEATAYTASGTERERVTLPPELFDGQINMPVMYQAVKAFLANQRQGNAATKTRGLVVGGNRKPWRQKGTGRARQGSIRAPNWVGGGTVFGPQPRSYAQYVPKQVRALARRSAFNARAREGAIVLIDSLDYDAPKTSRVVALLAALGLNDAKVLILTDGVKPNVYLSARNLPLVHVLPYSDVSAYHILWSDVVVMESPLVGQPLPPGDGTGPDSAPEERADDESAAPPASKRGRQKTAARKSGPANRKSTVRKATTKQVSARPAGQKRARKASAKQTTAKKTSAKKQTAAKRSAPRKKKGGT